MTECNVLSGIDIIVKRQPCLIQDARVDATTSGTEDSAEGDAEDATESGTERATEGANHVYDAAKG